MIKCYVKGSNNQIRRFKSSLENNDYKIIDERIPEAAKYGATNYTVGYVIDTKFLDFELVNACYSIEVTVHVGGHVYYKPMHSRKGFWKANIKAVDNA